jgi:hypothetical protein
MMRSGTVTPCHEYNSKPSLKASAGPVSQFKRACSSRSSCVGRSQTKHTCSKNEYALASLARSHVIRSVHKTELSRRYIPFDRQVRWIGQYSETPHNTEPTPRVAGIISHTVYRSVAQHSLTADAPFSLWHPAGDSFTLAFPGTMSWNQSIASHPDNEVAR